MERWYIPLLFPVWYCLLCLDLGPFKWTNRQHSFHCIQETIYLSFRKYEVLIPITMTSSVRLIINSSQLLFLLPHWSGSWLGNFSFEEGRKKQSYLWSPIHWVINLKKICTTLRSPIIFGPVVQVQKSKSGDISGNAPTEKEFARGRQRTYLRLYMVRSRYVLAYIWDAERCTLKVESTVPYYGRYCGRGHSARCSSESWRMTIDDWDSSRDEVCTNIERPKETKTVVVLV